MDRWNLGILHRAKPHRGTKPSCVDFLLFSLSTTKLKLSKRKITTLGRNVLLTNFLSNGLSFLTCWAIFHLKRKNLFTDIKQLLPNLEKSILKCCGAEIVCNCEGKVIERELGGYWGILFLDISWEQKDWNEPL